MFLGRNWDFVEMNKVSQTIQSPFPSVWMSVINYFSVCVMSAIAMAKLMKLKRAEHGEASWLV